MASNSRTLPWSAIPRHMRIMRILFLLSIVTGGIAAIFVGTITRSGINQPEYRTQKFTERFVLKGKVRYLTEEQAKNYDIALSIVTVDCSLTIILFGWCNLSERRFRKRERDNVA